MDNTEPIPWLRDLPQSLWRTRRNTVSPRYAERFKGERGTPSWSVHPFFEFTAATAGDGEVIWPRSRLPLVPDTVVLVPPGLRHRETGTSSLETVWIGFDAELAELNEFRQPQAVVDAALTRRVLRLWKLAALRQPGSGLELDGILLEIVGGWLRSWRSAPAAGGETFGGIIEYLHENYASAVDIPGLARRLGRSESYFFRRFRALTGATPVDYLNAIRIRQAMLHLTHSALPLRAIAPLCGFRDASYLSRVFKLHTGLSPRAFRQQSAPAAETAAPAPPAGR